MKTFSRPNRVRSNRLPATMIPAIVPTIIVCLTIAAFSFAVLPARSFAQGAAGKALEDWRAAQAAVAAAKEKLADAQKKLQTAMAAVAKSGKKATPEQEAALAGGRAEVARAEAALREAEKQELAARVALEAVIYDLPDSPEKDRLKRERNFPSLVAANGLYTVNFDTPSGQLKLSLPDDIRAGDTISGTVIAEPKGNTDEERNANRGVLSGYVVEIAGQKFPVKQGSVGPFVVRQLQPPGGSRMPPSPPVPDSFFDVFVGVDPPNGPTTTRARIQLVSFFGPNVPPTHPSGAIITPDPKITPQTPPSGQTTITGEGFNSKPQDLDAVVPGFDIPRLGQQGRPMVVPGPFDGNSTNTTANWTMRSQVPVSAGPATSGPASLVVIAESPRQAVFQSPSNVAGAMEVTIKDGAMEATGRFRNVGVELSAPKTTLKRGESTNLKVQVSGLEGIKEPVPLTLESQGVVTMTGGNSQPLTIQPSEVGPDGRYSTTRAITGVQAGGWTATATVVTGPAAKP